MVQEFEIFENRKLIRVVKTLKELEKYLKERKSQLEEEDYTNIEATYAYVVYLNYKKQKMVFLTYRSWYGLFDCKKKKIYEGDVLANDDCCNIYIDEVYRKDGFFNILDNETTRNLTLEETQSYIKKHKIKVVKSVFDTLG